MRQDLIKSVKAVADPVKIPDYSQLTDLPQQQKVRPEVRQAAQPVKKQFPLSGPEDVLILRVTHEYRMKGGNRLVIQVCQENNRTKAPNIKLRPGMRVRLVPLADLPQQNGDGNAKR